MVGLPPALLCGSGDPEERDMRFILASALVVVSLAGCGSGNTERAGQARDTVITSRQTRDTTIIRSDTSVRVDTTVKRGQEAVPEDTTE